MKKCKQGYYYCYKDKKCKRIPLGYRVGLGGWLRKEKEEEKDETTENGNHKNGNGSGNGGSDGGSNGGSVSEGWSEKYKKSIDCNNPKGFSQKAHCQGRKKMSEEKKDHEYSMARSQLKTVTNAAKRLQKKMGKKGEGNLQAWVQSKITKAADYIDTAADYVTNEETVKEEGLRDWFGKSKSKSGKKGWVDVVDGDACAREEGETATPKCVSSAKRASMSKKERLAAQAAKRRKDPGQPQKSGAAKPTMVKTDRKTRKEEMELSEYSSVVRAGIKVAGKRGGRAVQGGLKSGKTATKNAIQKKEAGKGEKIGKVIGGVVGGAAGGAAGAPLGGVGAIGAGIAGGEVGERVGGAIGRKFDKKKKKEDVTEAKDKKGKGSGTKDACYHKVKSRYSVWPSAYASGALVKCRKVGAANWGNKSESYEFSNWRDDFKATEYEFIDIIEAEPIKGGQPIEEGQKCWKGYEKKGTKKMFGKTYNNCVKKEEVESKIGGGNLKKLATKATKRIDADIDGDVDSSDMKTPETGEFIPSPDGKKKIKSKVRFEELSDWRSELGEGVMPAAIDPKAHRKQQRAAKVRNLAQKGATEGERAAAERKTKGPKMFGEDWQKVNKGDKTDGMSQKAVNAYRRENPGSKLKTAVTGDPKPGSKDAKRRKSFCARSKGQQDMHNIDCSKTPDKPVCKARRRWKC